MSWRQLSEQSNKSKLKISWSSHVLKWANQFLLRQIVAGVIGFCSPWGGPYLACRAHLICHCSPLIPTKGCCDGNADNAQQAELPIPGGESSVRAAASTEADVLDLPGSGAPVLAANFTGDSILASPSKWVSSLLVTVCSVGPRPTSADTEPVQSNLEKEAHPTVLLSWRSLFHVAMSCEGRGSASVI